MSTLDWKDGSHLHCEVCGVVTLKDSWKQWPSPYKQDAEEAESLKRWNIESPKLLVCPYCKTVRAL